MPRPHEDVKPFTFYWKNGAREVHRGEDHNAALEAAGYTEANIRALDFFMQGEDHTYQWNEHQREWTKHQVFL